MMDYVVIISITERQKYHIKADTPEEAKELVLSGYYDPYESEQTSIDNIEVEETVC